MNLENTQLKADRDRLFADWGEQITFRRIAQTFTPETQQISESETEWTLLTLVGNRPSANIPAAGGQVQTIDLVLQVKAEEWSGSVGETTWRADVAGSAYEVIGQSAAADGNVIELICRKVA
ncbi:MAG: hypothetical protein HUJ26_08175 [Planctomycetaceae bacterium]|nr:hypothetical protein [Planctomycetaceae bacterium]